MPEALWFMNRCRKWRALLLVIVLLAGLACETGPGRRSEVADDQVYGVTKGAFRGRWWNYYERGVSYADGHFWMEAETDLREALGQRSEDQRRARTYGMHFIDYFPHRELGVVLYHEGRYEEAVSELEGSLQTEKSAKAEFYLDAARKALIHRNQTDLGPPEIEVLSPLPNSITNAFDILVSGVARDDTYVKDITVNGVPVRVDLAAPEVSFSSRVPLKPGENVLRVVTTDLSGKQILVERRIRADWQGPILTIDEPVEGTAPAGSRLRLRGYAYDDRVSAKSWSMAGRS